MWPYIRETSPDFDAHVKANVQIEALEFETLPITDKKADFQTNLHSLEVESKTMLKMHAQKMWAEVEASM